MKLNIFAVMFLLIGTTACVTSGKSQGQSNNPPPPPITLSDLISPIPNINPRPSGNAYYAAILVDFNDKTPIPFGQCLSESFWTFVRFLFNDRQAARVSLDVEIVDLSQRHPTITFPVFMSQIDETKPANSLERCKTAPIRDGVTLTAMMPSSGQGFSINYIFKQTRDVSGTGIETVAQRTLSIVNVIAAASGFSVVSAGATRVITELASQLDASRNAMFSVGSQTAIVKQFAFFPNDESQRSDAWKVSLSVPQAGRGGVVLSDLQGLLTIRMVYQDSVIKIGGGWPLSQDVMTKPLFPEALNALNTFQKAIDTNSIGGVSRTALDSAKTVDEMMSNCRAIRAWLGTFLVGDDILVSQYSIIRNMTKYNTLFESRTDECFDGNQLVRLQNLSGTYSFKQPEPRVAPRDALIGAFTQRLNGALDSADATIAALSDVVTGETGFFSLARADRTVLFGTPALQEFRSASFVRCVQARKDSGDITLIGGILDFGTTRLPTLFHLNGEGRIERVELTSVDMVRASLRLGQNEKWPDSRPSCRLQS